MVELAAPVARVAQAGAPDRNPAMAAMAAPEALEEAAVPADSCLAVVALAVPVVWEPLATAALVELVAPATEEMAAAADCLVMAGLEARVVMAATEAWEHSGSSRSFT